MDRLEEVWRFTFDVNGFDMVLLMQGTEEEVVDYVQSDVPLHGYTYSAITDEEVQKYKSAGVDVYLAPRKY